MTRHVVDTLVKEEALDLVAGHVRPAHISNPRLVAPMEITIHLEDGTKIDASTVTQITVTYTEER